MEKRAEFSAWLSLAAFVIGVFVFRAFDWDWQVARHFFSATLPHWPGGDLAIVKILHKFGEWPAFALALFGLATWIISYYSPSRLAWRGPGIYLTAVAIFGMLFFINTVSKGITGRPRPHETLGLGGMWEFQQVFEFGIPGRGKSFLSGHAASGFFFLTLFFIWGGKPRRWAGLALGCLAGLLLGWSRIMQGKHWLSDIVLCGFAMMLICALLSPLIKDPPPGLLFRKVKTWAAIFLFSLAWFVISKPTYVDRRWHWPVSGEDPPAYSPARRLVHNPGFTTIGTVHINIERGDLRLALGWASLAIFEIFKGLAFPLSEISTEARTENTGTTATTNAVFTQHVDGRFYMGRGVYALRAPEKTINEVFLKTKSGSFTMIDPDTTRPIILRGAPPPAGLGRSWRPFGSDAYLREGKGEAISIKYQADTFFYYTP